jgi:hypothetical protein
MSNAAQGWRSTRPHGKQHGVVHYALAVRCVARAASWGVVRPAHLAEIANGLVATITNLKVDKAWWPVESPFCMCLCMWWTWWTDCPQPLWTCGFSVSLFGWIVAFQAPKGPVTCASECGVPVTCEADCQQQLQTCGAYSSSSPMMWVSSRSCGALANKRGVVAHNRSAKFVLWTCREFELGGHART